MKTQTQTMQPKTLFRVTGWNGSENFARHFADIETARIDARSRKHGRIKPLCITASSPYFLRSLAGFPDAQD